MLTFLAIVAPAIRDRAVAAAACAAGFTAVLAWSLPLRLGLLLTVTAGIAAGLLVESLPGGRQGDERLLAADPGARADQFHSARVLTPAIRALARAPATLQRALRCFPATVFSAILVPALVLTDGSVHIGLDNPRLLAGILASAIAWRMRNTPVTIVIGMLALHFFGYLVK